VGWRGPKRTTIEYGDLTACNILMLVFGETSVSPLQRDFVEFAYPLQTKKRGFRGFSQKH
jgi:hypothetical protein